MFSYGLTGIELSRAMERRDTERQQRQVTSTLQLPGRVFTVRQWLGDTIYRFGTRVSGTASAPQASPADLDVHPNVDPATPSS